MRLSEDRTGVIARDIVNNLLDEELVDLEIGEDGTNSLNVPQIDSEETDDDKTPVEEKAETPKEDKQPQAEETKDAKSQRIDGRRLHFYNLSYLQRPDS